MGETRYPKAQRRLIAANGASSKGYRLRLCKTELQNRVNGLDLPLTVCVLPPGTRQANTIERRLFSLIALNRRGKLLRSFKTLAQRIAATPTTTGLTVRAAWDEIKCPKG